MRSPLEPHEYRELKARIDGLNGVGVLEDLRLFTMDGEDKNAEACLVLYEEISAEDMMQLFLQVKKSCEDFGIGHTVIQVRYEVSSTGENEG